MIITFDSLTQKNPQDLNLSHYSVTNLGTAILDLTDVALRTKRKEMELNSSLKCLLPPMRMYVSDKHNRSKKNCPASLILITGYNSFDKSRSITNICSVQNCLE